MHVTHNLKKRQVAHERDASDAEVRNGGAGLDTDIGYERRELSMESMEMVV